MNKLTSLTELSELEGRKGSYVLILELPCADVTIGALGQLSFSGRYAYVGSAKSGLLARIRRHLSSDKKLHWHIDYLLAKARINEIYWSEESSEHEIAKRLSSCFSAVPGFGASDSLLNSHLFCIDDRVDRILKSFK